MKNLITQYLKSKIINPESLQIDSLSAPDSLFTSFAQTKEYHDLKVKCDSFHNVFNHYSDEEIKDIVVSEKIAAVDKFQADRAYKETNRLFAVIENRTKNFKGELNGWIVRVKFRAKDSNGNEKSDYTTLRFDKSMAKIESDGGVDL